MKNCDCEAWKKNYYKICEATIVAIVHGIKCDWPAFRYCPWCWKDLGEDDGGNE